MSSPFSMDDIASGFVFRNLFNDLLYTFHIENLTELQAVFYLSELSKIKSRWD
jgi:hypothetical protein